MQPFEREQTVQAGQTVPASLVNAMQDGTAAVANNRRLAWIPVRLQAASFGASDLNNGDIVMQNPASYLVDLPLHEGMILRTIRMVGSTAAGATMTCILNKRTYDAIAPGNSPVQIGSSIVWAAGGETETRKEIDVFTAVPPNGEPIILSDDTGNPTDTTYWLHITNSGATGTIHAIKALVQERAAIEEP